MCGVWARARSSACVGGWCNESRVSVSKAKSTHKGVNQRSKDVT